MGVDHRGRYSKRMGRSGLVFYTLCTRKNGWAVQHSILVDEPLIAAWLFSCTGSMNRQTMKLGILYGVQ